MSCNGCRVLRKGCSESCILRPCLQWIESPEAQGHATVFVAKFFGRAGLMSFISSVPETQRPALFQSLLFEACGRTVNPVNGAVGLLWTGNWHVCQTAVDTILRGGTLRPISDVLGGILLPEFDEKSEVDLGCGGSGGDHNQFKLIRDRYFLSKRKPMDVTNNLNRLQTAATTDLDLSLTPRKMFIKTGGGGGGGTVKTRPATPSMNSEDSVTTTSDSGGRDQFCSGEKKLLNLFV